MYKPILAILVLFSAATSVEAGYDTGNDLIVGVKASLRYSETHARETEMEQFARIYWTGHINGLRAASDLASGLGCAFPYKIPADVPASQLVRVIDKYLAGHPDKLNDSANVLIAYALQEAFPGKGMKLP